MIYNAEWAAVDRRPGATRRGKPPLTRVPESVISDVQYRFDVWSVLECHAIYRAAASTTRDVRGGQALKRARQPAHSAILECSYK